MDPTKLEDLADYKYRLHAVFGDERLLETPYGITQSTEGLDSKKVQEIEKNMVLYMENVVQNETNQEYDEIRDRCKNTKPECFKLKAEGNCTGSVKGECAPVCETCELLDHKYYCPMVGGIPPAIKPGELNLLFQRIVSEEYYQKYEPNVLSMPATNVDTNTSTAPDGSIIPDGPWLIVLDNFLTADECRYMQDLANEQNLHPIPVYVFQDYLGKVVSKVSNACNASMIRCETNCAEDHVIHEVTHRMANLTSLPYENFEYFRLARYEPGQSCRRHSDFSRIHQDRSCGPRAVTVFLYLNDVEQGGGTEFPFLNITIQPRMGRAALWPNVLNDRLSEEDVRTVHSALTPVNGFKYTANSWGHRNDFRTPHSKGCV